MSFKLSALAKILLLVLTQAAQSQSQARFEVIALKSQTDITDFLFRSLKIFESDVSALYVDDSCRTLTGNAPNETDKIPVTLWVDLVPGGCQQARELAQVLLLLVALHFRTFFRTLHFLYIYDRPCVARARDEHRHPKMGMRYFLLEFRDNSTFHRIEVN